MAERGDSVILEKHRAAAARWPGIIVGVAAFGEAVRIGLASGAAGIDDLHTDDLYLAVACVSGQPRAIAVFEREVMGVVRPSVERACRDGSASVDDVMQWTRERLVLGSADDSPKLTSYVGRGTLVSWVRVVAVREALQERRRSKRERVRDDAAALLADGPPAVAAELEVLRSGHAASFKAAVAEAIRSLTPEQRAILRFHTQDGLTIDQLAPMLGVHRATAARRLERARADALSHTRRILRESRGLSESEARSLCAVLGGEVDVSVGRVLSEEGAR